MLCKGLFVRSMVICCALMVQPATASAYDRPCRQDIEKFCSDVSPGGGRVAACLHKHYAELSPECKARGQELHERVQEAQAACKEDIAKYCKQIKPGGGRIVACLKEHDAELSADCKSAVNHPR